MWKKVLINYRSGYENKEMYLELKVEGQQNIWLMDFGSKKSLIEDGKVLARFLKVRLFDNHPHIQEVWGDADVSEDEVHYLNNEH